MKKTSTERPPPIATMAACFAVGVAVGWWLHASGGPRPIADPMPIEGTARAPMVAPVEPEPRKGRDSTAPPVGAEAPVATTGTPAIGAPPRGAEPGGSIEALRRRGLRLPIDGVEIGEFKGDYAERRTGNGGHAHEAVDILAPRHTPIRAIEDGTIAKVFESRAGGRSIYQFDPTQRFVYYYAHLHRYADGLHDGQRISAGEVIGYVGTTGNAPPGTPHLHFAIFQLGPEKRWWKGEALDPYLVYKR